jgi:hypothetical protein
VTSSHRKWESILSDKCVWGMQICIWEKLIKKSWKANWADTQMYAISSSSLHLIVRLVRRRNPKSIQYLRCWCVWVRSENEFLASHIDDRVITNVDSYTLLHRIYTSREEEKEKRDEEKWRTRKSYNTFCRHRLKIFQLAEPTPKAAVSLTT